MPLLDSLAHAWNAFRVENKQKVLPSIYYPGHNTSYRQSNTRLYRSTERTIVDAIYTRISIDVASYPLHHVEVDEEERFKKRMDSALERCLTLEPNTDQGPTHFRQDIVLSLCTKGVIALVPVDTSRNPTSFDDFDIHTLRVGEIVQWFPQHVRIDLYNEKTGKHEEVILEKKNVAIVENPFYSVMNEPNSVLKRLMAKLALLDNVDETSAGRLDLIVQLPYVVKSTAKREQAERRAADIEDQLRDSQYGIAYTDGAEKITQLNRPVENQLLKQVEYLTQLLYAQLGLDESVMNGTADEAAMLNYMNRTVIPILNAIKEAMQRAFLRAAKTAKGERIHYFHDPFRFVPSEQLAEFADKFNRNEILTGNEIRGLMHLPPSDDPKADELHNSQMPRPAIEASNKPISEPNDGKSEPNSS